jgi:hypothetical protein
MDKPVELGKTYHDTITGFTGVATARYEYLHGCVRWQLTRAHPETGMPLEAIFDEPQLAEVEADQHATTGATGGPHDESPQRQAAPPR